MLKVLSSAKQLIIAADFKPIHARSWTESFYYKRDEVHSCAISLAERLKETGVIIKVNSALRACGYRLIDEIHDCGLHVFADLKLFDIGETLSTDGVLLRETKPEIVTAACRSGVDGLKRLKGELPDSRIYGVSVLTSLASANNALLYDAEIAIGANLDGLVCSPLEIQLLREKFPDISLIVPNVRPIGLTIKDDDQNPHRTNSAKAAIKAGANYVVVGRPITQSADPLRATMQTIEEIESARN